MKKNLLCCLPFLSMGLLFSKNQATENLAYNQDFFLPKFSPTAGNVYRSANGNPGPMYWQNRMTLPEAMSTDETERTQYYSKTTCGLKMLRNVVEGKDRFDYAFRKYTEACAFKHPTPHDFFHCINSAAGENLNWFRKEWFFTNLTLDLAVTAVPYFDDDPAKGSLIAIENKAKMILPIIIKVVQSNGETGSIQLPVEILQRGGTYDPTLISRMVNTGFNMNFNDWINSYRVKAVIAMLQNYEHETQTLLGISIDCGFNSKSSFNRSFKKITGLSPQNFIKTLVPNHDMERPDL